MSEHLYAPLLKLKTAAEADKWLAARVAAIRAADPEKIDRRTDKEIAGLEASNAVVWFARFNHIEHSRIRSLFHPPTPSTS